MTQICMIFQVHQPYRLRNFHFFEIGAKYAYFDEEKNAALLRQVAENSYLPTNMLLRNLIDAHGDSIKIGMAISGTVLDQMEAYAPEVLESFQDLVATGNVELLGQTYGGSLSSVKNTSAFKEEVVAHKKRNAALFGKRSNSFLNTGLIYSDEIGNSIANLGFKAAITEGASQILNENSPDALYEGNTAKALKLLLRNLSLSDDISRRFSQHDWSEWPLTSEKYIGWLKGLPSGSIVNLVMDYATFGEKYKRETGIFDFLEYLLKSLALKNDLRLATPREIIKTAMVRSKLPAPNPISWSGPQKDLSPWAGNDLQKEAIDRIYALENGLKATKDKGLLKSWEYLKSADHFLYMDGDNGYNPYESPYDAFLKYMNVLSDLELKVQNKNKAKSMVTPKKNGKRQKVT